MITENHTGFINHICPELNGYEDFPIEKLNNIIRYSSKAWNANDAVDLDSDTKTIIQSLLSLSDGEYSVVMAVLVCGNINARQLAKGIAEDPNSPFPLTERTKYIGAPTGYKSPIGDIIENGTHKRINKRIM